MASLERTMQERLEQVIPSQVTVNQRSLIEKILARYAAEFTLYREALQNADDSNASSVEIVLGKAGEATVDLSRLITDVEIRNNGAVFSTTDWKRLTTIAEGNPDEAKIGNFGVGFYSNFAISDLPAVRSGSSFMQFYFVGDQLFIKVLHDLVPDSTTEESSSASPTSSANPWTSIILKLREPTPIPELESFGRFLATSLGFTKNLRNISVTLNGHVVIRLCKTVAPPKSLPSLSSVGLPAGSPKKHLRIDAMNETPFQIRAEAANIISFHKPAILATPTIASVAASSTSFASRMLSGFLSKSAPAPPPAIAPPTPTVEDPLALRTTTLFLRTIQATIKVTPTPHFASELLRATKKPLPQVTQVAIIFTSKDEADASEADATGVGRIFAGLRSDTTTNGRIFIGFSTFQTTGFGSSVAARFVPTVERESLDLQATYVAEWNRELLWAAGVTSRHVYELEMLDISRLWKNADVDLRLKLEQRAAHLLQFFTFSPSTPSAIVGQEMQRAFFTTSTKGFHMLSSKGVFPSSSVRISNPQLAKFYQGAVIPSSITVGESRMIAALTERNLVNEVSLEDAINDLMLHTLSSDETIACFQWWIGLANNRSYNRGLLNRLRNAAIIAIEEDGFAPLSSFQSYVNPKLIPLDLPLPSHTLPFVITKSFPSNQLETIFELDQLSLASFTESLVSTQKIGAGTTATVELLEKALSTLARGWSSLSIQDQDKIVSLLRIPCIPTSRGIQLPSESYFENVVIFDDLPIISLASTGKGMEQLLKALGVRRSVELQLVFSRMLGTGNWSSADLVVYLASVQQTLQANEFDRLKKTTFLSTEAVVAGAPLVRYRPDQLYEPTEALRALGLPILEWRNSGKWRSNSEEAKFLFKLGLLRSPPVDTLLKLAASKITHQKALDYFLAEYHTSGYASAYKPSIHSFAFVPANKDGQSILATPNEVFSDEGAKLFGLSTLDSRYKSDSANFKILEHPPASLLATALLAALPKDPTVANSTFAYLSTQLSKFSNADLQRIRSVPVIPIRSNGITLTRAASCFFGLDASIPSGLQLLFTTVPAEFDLSAKPFLSAIGVRETPSIIDVAEMLVEDPDRLYGLAGTTEKYLQLIRMIALNFDRLSPSVKSRMRLSSWYLGSRRITPVSSSNLLDGSDDEEESVLQFKLAKPSELLVVDDPYSAMIFADSIIACPQEDALENLALSLGANRISRLVSERYSIGGEPSESRKTVELRRAVEERTLLFLSERQQSSSGRKDLLHPPDWIKSHLVVREVQSLERVLSLTVGGKSKRHSSTTSACAQLDPKGSILLLIANSQELDFFEVAIGLCRLLLSKQRSHDPLLLMTILSTSLKNLKRRGFNVDRILNIRKAETQLAEQKLREQQVQDRLDLANSLTPEKLSQYLAQLEMMFPDAAPEHLISLLQFEKKDHLERATEALLGGKYPRRKLPPPPSNRNSIAQPDTLDAPPSLPTSSSASGSVFTNFKRKLLNPSPSPSPSSGRPEPSSASTAALRPPNAQSTSQLAPPSSSTSTGTPSSAADIRSNVLKAIQASRPSSNTVQNTLSKTQIKEAEGTYCDSSASADLKFLADFDGMRFFIDRRVENSDTFLARKSDAIVRMIRLVVKPVAAVFRLNIEAVHIFYDESGPLIAFNRNGSLFLNFRYYLSLHDEAVRANKLTEPLISCFHTLAHEIAHNLVGPHNSEFSFYFSSICEENFVRMASLLSQVQSLRLVVHDYPQIGT